MRKWKRQVLRNKANKISAYGKGGKSIKLFHSLWKTSRKKQEQQVKEERQTKGVLKKIKQLKDKRK